MVQGMCGGMVMKRLLSTSAWTGAPRTGKTQVMGGKVMNEHL